MTQAQGVRADAAPARFILGFVAALSAAKLLACFLTGFGDDEAYTIVIARQLSLSYFDHPPLHQWILHFFVAAFGEGRWDRLPFWAMQVATNLPLYGLTRRAIGRDAALWAIFVFNASAYFLIEPDGLIMPDPPLLLALATAVWALVEILFAPQLSEQRKTWLWTAVGVALGLAGLSKYSAALVPLSLLGFFGCSSTHRRWLTDARPYCAALLALVIFSPALIWNASHGWASLQFQSGRAEGALAINGAALLACLAAIGEQILSLSPWIALPAAAGLWTALRSRDPDSGARLLLWLGLPPLLLFALLPLVGQRAIPHWFNSGWLFVFPLAGDWIAGLTAPRQDLWARVSAICAALALLLSVPFVMFGPDRLAPAFFANFRDPTAHAFDWPSVAATRSWTSEGRPPDLILVENWRVGGRVGVALGPGVPICGFGPDPRGFAFTCDSAELVGRSALVTATDDAANSAFADVTPHFERFDAPEAFEVGRFGAPERRLQVARGWRLAEPFPAPYGLQTALSRR